MPINVPDNPKVYTTTYDNFKGVDFTNDSTNIWRRRSPTGTNMLPDESGRPFKRNGWYVLLSNRDLCDALSVYSYEEADVDEETFDGNKTDYFTFDGADYIQCTEEDVWDENETYYVRAYGEVRINKCAYFEIAGVDHIVVFTDSGVVFYNGEVTAINSDPDCYEGYDRSFFFEGNGTAAFYIYGNFKVWRYEADFQLHDVTPQITVPTVLISASAECVGEFYNGYNMLGQKAAVEYNASELYTWWCSDDISVDASRLKSQLTINGKGFWKWKRESGSWVWRGSSDPSVDWSTVSSYIDISGTQKNGQEIVVVYCNGVMLPNNVATAEAAANVEVYLSAKTQFDYPLNVAYQTTVTKGTCSVFSDPVTRVNQQAFVVISSLEKLSPIVTGEDYIKVVFPTLETTATTYTNLVDTNASNATLNGV